MSYLRTLYKYDSVYDMDRHMMCSEEWKKREERMNINRMPTQSCGKMGISVIKLTIQHPMAGIC